MIAGIDPHIVKVAVRGAGTPLKLLPPLTLNTGKIDLEDFVFVLRIDDQIGEIEGPPHHNLAGIEALQFLPPSLERKSALAFDSIMA